MTEETIIVDGRTSPKTIYKKRTSPKTIQIQDSKTARSKAEWLHISTSEEDGEGLQFGEGDLPFEKVIPILNQFNEKTFAIEVWKGHEQGGKGFEVFLDKIKEAGLIVT